MKKQKKWISDELRMKILDIMIYFCIFSVMLWFILKAFGVFSTPIWLELVPVLTGGIGALIVVYKFGYAFGSIVADVKHLKKDMIDVKAELKDFRRNYDKHIVNYDRHIAKYHV